MKVKAPQTREEFEAYIRAMDEANEAFFKNVQEKPEVVEETEAKEE